MYERAREPVVRPDRRVVVACVYITGRGWATMDLHHLGVATRSAAELADRYAELFDAPVVHEERIEGLQVVFLDFGRAYVELLEPLDGGGPVERFLDSNGPGIHHLAVATPDVAAALDGARAAGVDPIDESPRPGAWGSEVAFLHPSSTGGVLVELVEGAGR
jgi:methylmalonyl-CoA/ethylmalonyl-CoA epimerase